MVSNVEILFGGSTKDLIGRRKLAWFCAVDRHCCCDDEDYCSLFLLIAVIRRVYMCMVVDAVLKNVLGRNF